MRLELTKAQYDAMVDAMTAESGYKLMCDPHEGSTYQRGPYCLCQADGAFWLDLDVPIVPEVSPSVWVTLEGYAEDNASDCQYDNRQVREKEYQAMATFFRTMRFTQE